MKRGLLALVIATLAPAVLAAQTGNRAQLYFSELEGTADSAFVVSAGGTFSSTVRANMTSYPYTGLASFTLRINYDPAVVTFVSARSSCPDSVTYPLSTVTGATFVELSAGGCAPLGNYDFGVVTVQFQLAAGATAGTGLYVEPLALIDGNAVDRSMDGAGDYDEVCLGVGVWGDVSNNGVVNSQDALIALSKAVGLPTGAFAATIFRGDVDVDGYVGSRDALSMLSMSIGLGAGGSNFRTGKGVAAACAPQPLLPRTLYFIRQGPYNQPGLPGFHGLVVRAALDSAQTIAGDSADGYTFRSSRPRVSPNGNLVAFGCVWQNATYGRYNYICRSDAGGGSLVNLSGTPFSTDQSPDWSPAGDSIVFVRDNYIWVMAADGSNQHQIASSPYVQGAVAWDPTPGSRRIAYVAYTGNFDVRTRDLDSAGADSLVFTGTSSASPGSVDWSPAGDSLVFGLNVDGNQEGVFVAARSGGGAPARVARLRGYTDPNTQPFWTDQGILFNVYQTFPGPGRHRLFLLRPDNRMVMIGRDPTGNFGPGMDKQ